ncbi:MULTISPECIES: MmcQ/YjbR family DNA-binding protein [unclassified Lysobacter]|uniref:MmcQ/YjbR family DNA-binding protein n=1 Tax=unclassified Lysobacter TaxID=2635362 RepID=UPI001BE56C2D|nr:MULTISPECIES: MmcQ/YjbR family DNA-binding protein [unclassified Lysobacter]MBT2745793.1 MmcQ/YjbR family DNA-binding protein [Lysobacter sp. ISL-42]MBT2749648.1 MmcQ/YjbR family DNA-binding protein [Lysobacter sp. ISL-50]MBT2777633.1 MmcQ/YjbR family DNA-binding protein [Lysobacter sp. ISL-54]MBT2782121.1 MmcQ/YjbR family DNA-binding protein [Lysobacter sp. ISL-52]
MRWPHPPIPPAILTRLNAICLGLPEAYEEPAWTGIRWMVAKKNFAHVVMIDNGWPPAYAEAAGSPGPMVVLTFRLPIARLAAPKFSRPPFFRPVWFANIVGVAVDMSSDWEEIADLLTESYCVLAPKKLAVLLDRPNH